MSIVYETEAGIVYSVETFPNGSLIRQVLTPEVILVLELPESFVVGTTATVIVKYKDWRGNELSEQTADIKVSVTGDPTVEGTIIPSEGVGEFDFLPENAGEYVIKAEAQGITYVGTTQKVVVVSG